MTAVTFPSEFRNVQANYPIVFYQRAGRKFHAAGVVRISREAEPVSQGRYAGMRTIYRWPWSGSLS